MLITILNILAIFCAILMSRRMLVKTISVFKYKFNIIKIVKNEIDKLKNFAIKYSISPLSEKTKIACLYISLGISLTSFAALLYKAFVQ